MLSIIVSSVKKERLEALRRNIASTIGDGVEYEVLAKDNGVARQPLATVYNSLAAGARGDYLLFIHEDAGFLSGDWWKDVQPRLAEPTCGLIGFAGGKAIADAPGGWNSAPDLVVCHFRECGVEISRNHPVDEPFTAVAAVDGYAFFVRREVWMENPFDETLLTGFHCYDVDFSLTIGKKYRNYVCNGIHTYHDSHGNFGRDWMIETGKMYSRKWCGMLPVKADGCMISDRRLHELREQVFFRYIKILKRAGLPYSDWLAEYKKLPMGWRHFRHLVKLPFIKRGKK